MCVPSTIERNSHTRTHRRQRSNSSGFENVFSWNTTCSENIARRSINRTYIALTVCVWERERERTNIHWQTGACAPVLRMRTVASPAKHQPVYFRRGTKSDAACNTDVEFKSLDIRKWCKNSNVAFLKCEKNRISLRITKNAFSALSLCHFLKATKKTLRAIDNNLLKLLKNVYLQKNVLFFLHIIAFHFCVFQFCFLNRKNVWRRGLRFAFRSFAISHHFISRRHSVGGKPLSSLHAHFLRCCSESIKYTDGTRSVTWFLNLRTLCEDCGFWCDLLPRFRVYFASLFLKERNCSRNFFFRTTQRVAY